ncbi:MAG: DUF2510 domain-containing protein [Propionibacteriaceae bacterium]|nr:DUF2510 domain-containing protein [Propionibacteriaceae bacterium]
MSQARLPDWYPDESDADLVRWWDGLAWTDATRPARAEADALDTRAQILTTPAPRRLPRESSHSSLIAGLFFLAAAFFAAIQALYMSTAFSRAAIVTSGIGLPIALPFNWYLVLFPYWTWVRAFFSWGLIPPVLVLAGCAALALVLGRRRPSTAILCVAALLTVQNLLLVIPIFIDAGSPTPMTRPIFMPSLFASAGATSILAGLLIVYVVVWSLPLLFAASAVGSASTRRRWAILFLVVAAAYFLWYLAAFVFASPAGSFLLTPGPPQYLGVWLAPLSTLICLGAMTILIAPALRRTPV